jgi:hypothetical protein
MGGTSREAVVGAAARRCGGIVLLLSGVDVDVVGEEGVCSGWEDEVGCVSSCALSSAMVELLASAFRETPRTC